MELTKEQKQDLIQKAARKAWNDGGQWGLLAMATGTGKSKCAVDETIDLFTEGRAETTVKQLQSNYTPPIVYLVVPTEKLRDNNWEGEFKKWSGDMEYRYINRYCYASINKVKDQIIDLVILDKMPIVQVKFV